MSPWLPGLVADVRRWYSALSRPSRRANARRLRRRGFAYGEPGEGDHAGVLNRIYLRWEYHGPGLGRRMMAESARRFVERGMRSFMLFAERSNPSIGFYDRMGGERLRDERGRFTGAFGWRDVGPLLGARGVGTRDVATARDVTAP